MTVWSPEAGAGASRQRALWSLWFVLPLLAVAYQVVAKEAACTLASTEFGWTWLAAAVRSPWMQLLVVLEIGSFAAWMLVLEQMKLSAAFSFSAVSYVLVLLASWVVFGENGSVMQVMGSALILAGVWLIGRGGEGDACDR